MKLATIADTLFKRRYPMTKLLWIALCAIALAGCAGNHRGASGTTSSSGGSSATTAPSGQEDMRGSRDSGPGPEGDKQRPAGSSTAPRNTY